ncbi:MAG: hypothetical protein MPK10_05200 [Gammaproteobacteria bacterium]|nr:hypothetical protein [Gammaproteobacteria bacterium]CAJ2376859.1 MAG: conserved hypothetical protein [Arenicellales bacterium IbO2]
MPHNVYGKIIDLITRAAALARTVGIENLLQPGLVKEIIIADALGHEVISAKRGADARDPGDHSILYEYLSCKEGGTGQLDRMFKAPREKRAASLDRIRRNHKIYFAIFYKANQTKIKTIYELDPPAVETEANRQLDKSRNTISHVGFSEAWAKRNGKIVHGKP